MYVYIYIYIYLYAHTCPLLQIYGEGLIEHLPFEFFFPKTGGVDALLECRIFKAKDCSKLLEGQRKVDITRIT